MEYRAAYKNLIKTGVNLLFPPSCLGCQKRVAEHGSLCGHCWREVKFIERPYCEVLGTPFEFKLDNPNNEKLQSAEAIANPPSFNRARAVARYDPIIRKMVSQLKFLDQIELAPWMAVWMARAGRELLADNPIIVPVPLHRKRQFFRRYNQSAELARHIAKETGLKFNPALLSRIKPTRQQIGLGTKQRQRNVMGAFKVLKTQAPNVKGAKILLIDDVYTTGSTLEAASRAFLRAGAAQVDCLTFARVVRDT